MSAPLRQRYFYAEARERFPSSEDYPAERASSLCARSVASRRSSIRQMPSHQSQLVRSPLRKACSARSEASRAARRPCSDKQWRAAASSRSERASGSGEAEPLSLAALRREPEAQGRNSGDRQLKRAAAKGLDIWMCDLPLGLAAYGDRSANHPFRGRVSKA